MRCWGNSSVLLKAAFWRAQRRRYSYVHVAKKRPPHLLGFGSEWRKCFVVHPGTQTSRPLESHQWLSGSVLEEGLPGSLPPVEGEREAEVEWFEERVQEAATEMRDFGGGRWLQRRGREEVVRSLLSSALAGLWMSGEEHLQASSLTSDPRVESYWRRDGSNFLCVSRPLLILHCSQPLQLFSDPAHLGPTLSAAQHPRHLGLFEHSFDQITPFNGCHRFSPTPFTHTVFCLAQRARGREQLLAHGLMQLFSAAAAECVQNGYPLDQDLAFPLCSQGVVTNGHQVMFLCYQLNTLDLRGGLEGQRRNVGWAGPVLDLFSGEAVNREFSQQLLQFLLHRPARRRPSESGFGLKREQQRMHG